jgi:SAM-dependent methyltransferase
MVALKKLSRVMESPLAYRLWQAPAARSKFDPILRHNDLAAVSRVLDVGCGPGTNAPWFDSCKYLGLDVNPAYVEAARRRYGRDFQVADVCAYEADPGERFDFILINSVLHHIDDLHTRRILQQLAGQLTPDGHIHILDLVLPHERSVARTLALNDRGDWPRPLDEWRRLFSEFYEPVVCEPYGLRALGVTLWNMVYFKGRARR